MCSSAVDLTNVSHFLDPYERAGELIPLVLVLLGAFIDYPSCLMSELQRINK